MANENEGCVHKLGGVLVKVGVPIFSVSDDIAAPITKAANLAESVGKFVVGGAFTGVGVLELYETALEVKHLRKELKELKNSCEGDDSEIDEEENKNIPGGFSDIANNYIKTNFQNLIIKSLENQLKLTGVSLTLILGCTVLGALLIAFAAGVALAGTTFFPVSIMATLLVKEFIDLAKIQTEIKAQKAISNEATGADKNHAEKNLVTLKKARNLALLKIAAQILIVVGFALALAAANVATFGLPLMIAGASLALLIAVNEICCKPEPLKNNVFSFFNKSNSNSAKNLSSTVTSPTPTMSPPLSDGLSLSLSPTLNTPLSRRKLS